MSILSLVMEMRAYFEGWYFKQQNDTEALAFIPSFHIDKNHRYCAFIQVVTPDAAYSVKYPATALAAQSHRPILRIGNNIFSPRGVELDIEQPQLSVHGRLSYDRHRRPSYDIMGPFRWVPAMECRHSVVSLAHRVNGQITINGRSYLFQDGRGYIEGDRGCSFPQAYAWTQCSWGDNSLMLSEATIPFLGMHFRGIIAAVLLNGREYRLATYRGARLLRAKDGEIVIRQGAYTLTAKLLKKQELSLPAPVSGAMIRAIKESLCCQAAYCLEKNGVTLLDIVSPLASFEYEHH